MSPAQRALAFWGACIPLRAALALLARRAFLDETPGTHKPASPVLYLVRHGIVLFCLATAISWGVHYFFGTRPVAFEAGGAVWWNALRPAHAALYLLFVWHALGARRPGAAARAWRFLALDVIFGALAWLVLRA